MIDKREIIEEAAALGLNPHVCGRYAEWVDTRY